MNFESLTLVELQRSESQPLNTLSSSETTNEFDENKNIVPISVGPRHFDVLKLIGEGAFGKVFVVRNLIDKQVYAMKVISKRLIKKKNHVAYVRSEKEILTKVMDFLGGGEFFLHLRKSGLIFEKGIIHRDLKPENVLLGFDGHISLTDFGLAKEIGFDVNVRTLCGTSEYMAPEMLTRNGYGKAVDWWSLGALLYEMMTGKPPFQAKSQELLDRMILTEKFHCPSFLSPAALSLLRGLLQKDPSKRLGAAKTTMFELGGVAALKQHQFFSGIDWQRVYNKELLPPYRVERNGDFDVSNFHEGFTQQVISQSLVDDTVSCCSTPPDGRSRGGSLDDDFKDFSYTDPNFIVTETQLSEFEIELQNKIQINEKKKLKRMKTEEIKKKKLAEEALLREKLQLEEEQKRLEEKMRQEAIANQQKLLAEKKKKEKERQDRMKRKEMLQRAYDEFNETLQGVQKKIKRLKKKLREINDLEERISSTKNKPTQEQQLKIQQKENINDDILEAEEEEEKLLERQETGEFNELLNWQDDEDIVDQLLVEEETGIGKSMVMQTTGVVSEINEERSQSKSQAKEPQPEPEPAPEQVKKVWGSEVKENKKKSATTAGATSQHPPGAPAPTKAPPQPQTRKPSSNSNSKHDETVTWTTISKGKKKQVR